jgi:hypothetical protein
MGAPLASGTRPDKRKGTTDLRWRDAIAGTSPHWAGGLVLGGGGLSIPSRNCSPVALCFQTTDMLRFSAWSIVIAPGHGHSRTQVPQYQHSSG